MNKFNNSVKRNKKAILSIVIVAIASLILCIASSITIDSRMAEATPNSLQETLDQTSTAYYDALAAKEKAENQVFEAEITIEKCEKEISYVQNKIFNMAKNSYMNSNFGAILQIFTGAKTIEDLVCNIQYRNFISAKNAAAVRSLKELKSQVESEKATLDANLNEAEEQARIAEEAYNTAQAALAAAEAEQQRGDGDDGGGGGGGGGGGYVPDAPCNPSDIAATAIAIADAGIYWYEWGAAGPTTFDCSGLVSWCYGGHGRHIFTTTTFTSQSSGFHRIHGSQAVPGDVVSTEGHCGIYIGGDMMVHAPQTGEVVKISHVHKGMDYYTRR